MEKVFHVRFLSNFDDSKIDLYEAGKVYAFTNQSRVMYLENMGHEVLKDYKGEVSKPCKYIEPSQKVRLFVEHNEPIVEGTPVEAKLDIKEDISTVLEEAGKELAKLTEELPVEEESEAGHVEEEKQVEEPLKVETPKRRTRNSK